MLEIATHYKNNSDPNDWKKGDIILGEKCGSKYYGAIWDGEKETKIEGYCRSGKSGKVTPNIDPLRDNINIWSWAWFKMPCNPPGTDFYTDLLPYIKKFRKFLNFYDSIIYSFEHQVFGTILVHIPYEIRGNIDQDPHRIFPTDLKDLTFEELEQLFTKQKNFRLEAPPAYGLKREYKLLSLY